MSSSKVLVLGASGMAGHVVTLYLREQGFEVETATAHHKLDEQTHLIDVTDATKLRSLLDSNKYDVVINCIGVLIAQSEERKDLAAYLNSYLPHFLENYYKDSKTKIIHLSTDCVFSGKKPPYREDSLYDGQLFYDRSKALGEIINSKDLTFRMSIIGPDMNPAGVGLFNWFAHQTGEIGGYTKAIWTGVTTIELAKAIAEALNQDLSGLYHLVPDESISKFNLLELFKEVFGLNNLDIKPDSSVVQDKSLINTRQDFKYKVPSYKVMIEKMKDWISTHGDIYGHYDNLVK